MSGFCKFCGGWLNVRSLTEHETREECVQFLRNVIEAERGWRVRLKKRVEMLQGELDDLRETT